MVSTPRRQENTPLVSVKSHRASHGSIQNDVSEGAKARKQLDVSTLSAKRKLQLACICSLVFMVAEIIGGFMAGSLAIMTDAAHLLSDVAGFCISLFAIWVQTLPSNSRLTFGFQRAEVIGAITSVLLIWVLTGCLVYAAIEKFIDDMGPNPSERVNGKLMFIVACIGLVVNLALMKILGHSHSHGIGGGSHGHSHGEEKSGHAHDDTHSHSHGHGHDHHDEGHSHSHGSNKHDLEVGHKTTNAKPKKKLENLNIEAAYIHALGDLLQSVGVCIAGALIWYNPEWQIADPIATFVFSILVLGTTVGVIKSSLHVLMEGTPEGYDPHEIEAGLRALPSVEAVHDLHIWSLSAGMPSLSVHIISNEIDVVLHEAQDYLISQGIHHSTIQVEKSSQQYPRDCAEIQCGHNSP